MEITGETFKVSHDAANNTIILSGSLRLQGVGEYAPVLDLFEQVLAQEPPQIILDLQQLEFLNSSGIHVLSKFVISVRQKKTVKMLMRCSDKIPWQKKSLKNVQRLMPTMETEWV